MSRFDSQCGPAWALSPAWSVQRDRSDRSDQRGVALLEFALILPLLLLVSLIGLELVRTSTSVKMAIQLSREAANVAYRECVDRTQNAGQMQQCLELCEQQLETTARQSIDPDAEIILSYYSTNSAASPVITRLATTNGTVKFATQFSTTSSNLGSAVRALPDQSFFVGEVYIPYRTVIRSIGGLFRYDLTFVYDATVL